MANAGHALLQLGRREEAVERYRLAVELDPGVAGAAPNLAALLRESGQAAEAQTILDHSFAAGSHHPGLYLETGLLAAEAGDFETALLNFREAASRDSANPVPLGNAARAATLLGRMTEAAELYEEMLRLAPGRPEIWATLGGIYGQHLAQPERARQCFERARELAPTPEFRARVEEALSRLSS